MCQWRKYDIAFLAHHHHNDDDVKDVDQDGGKECDEATDATIQVDAALIACGCARFMFQFSLASLREGCYTLARLR